MLTDLIDEFISRARAHVDAHPVRYEFAQCEIDITIRCLIDLRELLEAGQRRPSIRDLLNVQRQRDRITVALLSSMRDHR
jgi:hypothetical protein